MDWIKAHAKFIPPAIAAVLVIFLDSETAQAIAATVGAILTAIVPNDQAAIDRIYHKRRRP